MLKKNIGLRLKLNNPACLNVGIQIRFRPEYFTGSIPVAGTNVTKKVIGYKSSHSLMNRTVSYELTDKGLSPFGKSKNKKTPTTKLMAWGFNFYCVYICCYK